MKFPTLFPSTTTDKKTLTIAITGGKGGIGKSNIALNISIALAELGSRVLLFDADIGLANIDLLLGLKIKKNLSHVLEGTCSLADICVSGPKGITILPGASGVQKMADLPPLEQARLIHAFSTLSQPVDTLVIDSAAGISSHVLNFVQSAQEIIVVVCNESTSITDAYALIKLLNKKYGLTRFRILVNMVQQEEEGLLVIINYKMSRYDF